MPKRIIQDGVDFGYPCSHGTGYVFCLDSCPKEKKEEKERDEIPKGNS